MIVDHPRQRGRSNYKHSCFSSAGDKKPEYNMSYTDKKKCVLVHMERYSPHQTDRKQQSAQHEKRQLSFFKPKFPRRHLSSQAKVQLSV